MGLVATPEGPVVVTGSLRAQLGITGYVSSINGKQGAVELELTGGGTESVGGINPNEFGDVPIFKAPGGTIQVATPDQYGNGSGGTDWHVEIGAVLAAGKCLVGKYGKTYPTSGRHTVPEGGYLGGFGGAAKGVNLGSTTFQLTSSGAGFDFVDGAHTVQDVMVDGNNVATNPVHFGSSDPTHIGAQTTIRGLAVLHAAAGGSAVWVQGTQNGRVYGLNVINNAGDGLYFSDNAGGWNFYGWEITGSGAHSIHGINSGNIAFWGSIGERDTSTTLSDVLIEGSVAYPDWLFDHCTFASGGSFATGTSLGTGLALSASADTITKTAHGMFAGQAVSLSNIVTATGVTAATTYWVLNPTANTFQLTATQYGTTPVDITADGTADVTKFVRYLLEHRGTGAVELRSCAWAGIPTEAAIMCAGADVGAGTHAPVVALTGVHTVTHTIPAGTTIPGQVGGMVAFIDGDSLGVVYGPDHPVRGQVAPAGPIPLHTGNLPTANIGRFPPSGMTVNRTTATLRASGSYVNGDTAMRSESLVDGTWKLGPGNAAADVVFTRNGVGSAFITGSLTGSATIGAPGWRYTRLDHTAVADGTITLDASAATGADLHHVFMAGHNVTLAISGGSVGQFLYVYVQQNASPATLTLPLLASGVLWTGADAGKPPLTSATGWLTFVLECVSAGVWIERSRGGTNVVLGAVGAQVVLTDAGVKTTTYTAAANEIVRCDATSGTFAVTLPTAPASGTRVVVKKVDSSANAVTISRGGTDVFNVAGGSTSLTLNYQFTSVTVAYYSGVWIVLASDVGADLRISGAVQTSTLAALATGLLKSTTTTGALSIAVAADIPTAASGSTGPLSATDPRAGRAPNFDVVSGGIVLPCNHVTASSVALIGGSSGIASWAPIDLIPGRAYDAIVAAVVTTAQSGGTGTTTTTVALYADKNGQPDVVAGPVASGTITLTSTGNRIAVLGSSYTATAVRYWVGLVYVEASFTGTRATLAIINVGICIGHDGGTTIGVNSWRGWSATGLSGMPTGATTLTGTATPYLVGVRST